MVHKIFQNIAIVLFLTIGFTAVIAQEQSEQQSIVKITDDANLEAGKHSTAENKSVLPKKRQSSSTDDWTGFYVGGYAGDTMGRAAANTSTLNPPQYYFANNSVAAISTTGTQRVKSNGFNGGGTFGYNHQAGRFFVGGEIDFGTHRINKSASGTATYPCCAPTSFTITQSVKSNWIMTARPRVGVALKNALLYATGGVAVTNIKYDGKFTDTFSPATESGSFKKTKTGWTVGAGIEFKIAEKWSVKGDYLFSQFKRDSIESTNLNIGTAVPFQPFTHSTDLKIHSLRFGINYRF